MPIKKGKKFKNIVTGKTKVMTEKLWESLPGLQQGEKMHPHGGWIPQFDSGPEAVKAAEPAAVKEKAEFTDKMAQAIRDKFENKSLRGLNVGLLKAFAEHEGFEIDGKDLDLRGWLTAIDAILKEEAENDDEADESEEEEEEKKPKKKTKKSKK